MQHTFQILTKRPERMREYLSWRWGDGRIPMRNIWLGVSVEDQKTADERIPLLLQTPAAIRWVSYEPALAAVDFTELGINTPGHNHRGELDWLVVGGESGPGARPFSLQWARDVIAQCKAADVPCFVKQLGTYPVISPDEFDRTGRVLSYRKSQSTGLNVIACSDSKGGDWNEWPEDLRVREYPT